MEGRKRLQRDVLIPAWLGTFALGTAGPILRAVTGVHGIARWPAAAIILVTALTWYLLRRRADALWTALLMSASALSLGASLGFFASGIWRPGLFPAILALKWAGFGIALCAAFAWETRRASASALKVPDPDTPYDEPIRLLKEYRDLAEAPGEAPEEELRVKAREVTASLQALVRHLERQARFSRQLGLMLILVGAVLILLAVKPPFGLCWWSTFAVIALGTAAFRPTGRLIARKLADRRSSSAIDGRPRSSPPDSRQ